MVCRIALCLSLIFSQSLAHAEILFEGYSKILSGGVHVGYTISRYEFDPKKKQFISTSLVKTNEAGGGITEGLKAYATDDLKPLSYSYTSVIGKTAKTIDAKFEKGKIMAVVRDGGKEEKISKDIPKGSFLSMFLVYVMLKSPQGLKPDTKYDYQSIAEEEASLVKGVAAIKNQEDLNGFKVFKIINDFRSTQFISYVNEKGEILMVRAPVQGITTELVAQPSTATNNMQVPTSLIKKLFGDVPTGQKNEVSKANHAAPAKAQPAPMKNDPKATKQQGVAPGQGLHLKGGAAEGEGAPDAK